MIEVKNVSKRIKGTLLLDDINILLKNGIVYGIIGQNGSGKTMLFRVLAGLIKPTQGSIIWEGMDKKEEPNIGVVIEHASLYPDFTGIQNLNYLAQIRKKASKQDIRTAIKRVGLNPDDKRNFRKYSLGMKQRLLIAQALMEQPELLLFDEPTNGLDTNGIKLFYNIVREEAKQGAIVCIASHMIENIMELCDEIYSMKDGKLEKITDNLYEIQNGGDNA